YLKPPPEPERIETIKQGATITIEKDLTPEQKQEIADSKASAAFFQVKGKEVPILPIARERAKDWLPLAKEYDAVAESHPNSPKWSGEATKRATEIREEIKRLEKEYNDFIGAAEAWWKAKSDEL